MSRKKSVDIGTICWVDLTTKNAEKIQNFYTKVVGWKTKKINMGKYDDYCMNSPTNNQTVAGICHARGVNAKMPSQWMLYVNVKNLDKSVAQVKKLGGKLMTPIKTMGESRYCVIKDPSGAMMGLFESKAKDK